MYVLVYLPRSGDHVEGHVTMYVSPQHHERVGHTVDVTDLHNIRRRARNNNKKRHAYNRIIDLTKVKDVHPWCCGLWALLEFGVAI